MRNDEHAAAEIGWHAGSRRIHRIERAGRAADRDDVAMRPQRLRLFSALVFPLVVQSAQP
jgi:hypothetical protein